MKILPLFLFICIATSSFAQGLNEIKNQALKKIFPQEQSQRKEYSRFQKPIDSVGKNYYRYGYRTLFLNFEKIPSAAFVLSGFNPDIVFGAGSKNDSINICCLEELKTIQPDGQTRRFSFWLFSKLFLNPTEWYLEFYNKNATKETPLTDFFKEAVMTFYYQGGIII